MSLYSFFATSPSGEADRIQYKTTTSLPCYHVCLPKPIIPHAHYTSIYLPLNYNPSSNTPTSLTLTLPYAENQQRHHITNQTQLHHTYSIPFKTRLQHPQHQSLQPNRGNTQPLSQHHLFSSYTTSDSNTQTPLLSPKCTEVTQLNHSYEI